MHGITYNKTVGSLGTVVLPPIFELNDQFVDDQSNLVVRPGNGVKFLSTI